MGKPFGRTIIGRVKLSSNLIPFDEALTPILMYVWPGVIAVAEITIYFEIDVLDLTVNVPTGI